jgi:hypothetical protein
MVINERTISLELRKLANRHLRKETRILLNELWGSEDYSHCAQQALVSYLLEYQTLIENEIAFSEKKGMDVFFFKNKLDLVSGKIKFFKVYSTKEEFYKAHSLLLNIQKEMVGNV